MERSLAEAKKISSEIIAILHYPPFDEMRNPTHMLEIIKSYGVKKCIYGHIHGHANFTNLPDELLGVKLYLTSADYLDFKPFLVQSEVSL